jgi:Ca2+-binding RTX toxin-like protein
LDLADYGSGGAVAVDLSGAWDRATRGAELDVLREIEGAIGSGSGDVLRGDASANLFRGRGGKDTLTGGGGADDFDFDAIAHSAAGAHRDVVTDFAPAADDLDLSTIDARAETPAVDDTFAFLAARGAAFTGAGQVRWHQSGGDTFVEANVDADNAAELQVELAGLRTLSAADFVL